MATDLTTTLANIALATNNHPRGRTPKLDSVGDDPDERFFMLATFCFDLSRKLKYISYALQDYEEISRRDDNDKRGLSEYADERFKAKILADECYINPKPTPIPWEAMAIRAEEVMKRLHVELVKRGYPDYPPEGGCPPC
jgi:hypothetical protein